MRPFALLVLVIDLICPLSLSAGEAIDPSKGKLTEDRSTRWFDLRVLDIEGQGWRETKAPFDRLPATAEGKVRDAVWGLSRQSAGLCARFETDATSVKAKWTLTSANLAMPHMPATGVSGLDLYVRSEDGFWRWLANGRPAAQTNEVTMAGNIPPPRRPNTKREFLLYLPLYNGVASARIGVAPGATLAATPAAADKPVVVYGTSIVQGAVASRAGLAYPAQLGRRLARPVLNLGFSEIGRASCRERVCLAV